MDIIFYTIAIIIFLIPFFAKGIHHLDIMPIFLFYFDATNVFIRHTPSYQYFEYTLILLISLYIIFIKNEGRRIKDFWVITFLVLPLIIFPLLQGISFNKTLRDFSIVYAAMIFLPLSFSHYSKNGNIKKLLFSTFLLIVFFVLFVFYATPQRLGGMQSERVAGNVFYFGHVAIRGGITYMGFVLLMVPLALDSLQRHWQKIMLLVAVGFVFVFFVFVLKRFVFIVIALGLLNYMLHPGMKAKTKLRIGLFFTMLAVLYYVDIGIQKNVRYRYEERGGEKRFSETALFGDLRIYEPLYVLQAAIKKPMVTILFGDKRSVLYDITHEAVLIRERKIHNDYAGLISHDGLIGLWLYLIIYYNLYRYVGNIYRLVKKKSSRYLPYWIAFQNLVLIFLFQGMVGGHSHVSLRGLVFLYAGALGGVLYHGYRKELLVKKAEKIKISAQS